MDWILHLDTDELVHPGTQDYSLRLLLSDVPGNVDMVIFPNYVSRTNFYFGIIFSFLIPSLRPVEKLSSPRQVKT